MTALLPARAPGASVDALREAFDSTFALPPAQTRARYDDVLAIGIGDAAYALRVAELGGVHVDKPVTAVPGSPPAVRGVAGFRGAVVVVYDLAVLLGAPGGGTCRWIATAAADPRVAIAFSRFDGHVRVPSTEIAAADSSYAAVAAAPEVVRVGDTVRPIVRVSILLDTVTQPFRAGARSNEG